MFDVNQFKSNEISRQAQSAVLVPVRVGQKFHAFLISEWLVIPTKSQQNVLVHLCTTPVHLINGVWHSWSLFICCRSSSVTSLFLGKTMTFLKDVYHFCVGFSFRIFLFQYQRRKSVILFPAGCPNRPLRNTCTNHDIRLLSTLVTQSGRVRNLVHYVLSLVKSLCLSVAVRFCFAFGRFSLHVSLSHW